MAPFLKIANLSLFLTLPLFDCNVISQFTREASASSSASSKLPVTSLQKQSHISLSFQQLKIVILADMINGMNNKG
jgi:hypothetical protein